MPRGRPCKCPYEGCGSTNTVGKGVRVTKTLGIRKIRRCKSCGRKFTPKNQKMIPVEGDHTNEAQIGVMNEAPSKELVSTEAEDSTGPESERSVSDDQQEIDILDPEEPTNGY